MQLVIPLICFLIGGAIGYVTIRRRAWALFAIVAIVIVLGILWTFVKAEEHTGWDALAYGILAILFLAPGLLGQFVGGGIGLYRTGKLRQRADDDDSP